MGAVVEEVHAAGGVYVADEVQAGFARLGESMWGFTRHGVLPDIVTMGKPMGNGMPMSGWCSAPRSARTSGRTSATSTPSPAARSRSLPARRSWTCSRPRTSSNGSSTAAGRCAPDSSRSPATLAHVTEVRGNGLYVGVEIVTDTAEPDRARAENVITDLRNHRILISGSGEVANVLKIRPPLAFDDADVTRFLETFAKVADTHL